MRFNPIHCPECGEAAWGTLEKLHGCAELTEPDPETGAVDYSGFTEVLWNGQTTVAADGKVTLLCRAGHEWQAEDVNGECSRKGE